MKNRAERAQQLDRHSRPVAQHLLGGRVGEQDLSLGVDDEHRLRHAVKAALQHGGRKPEFVMGGDQMLGALGDRGLQRLVGGLGGAERIPQFPARAAGRHRQNGGEDQNQRDAGEIDRQQEHPVGFGSARRAKSSLRSSATAFARFPAIAAVAARSSWLTSAARPRCLPRSEPDQLAIDRNLALHQRLGLFDQLLFDGIVLDGFDQCRERRQDRVAGLAVFPGELLIAGERRPAPRSARRSGRISRVSKDPAHGRRQRYRTAT